MHIIFNIIIIYLCSSSRGFEEGDRETEASLSPSEPQEDGK